MSTRVERRSFVRRAALIAIAVAVACLASFTIAGTVGVAAKHQSQPVVPRVVKNQISNSGQITVGSQWTYYDWDGFEGLTGHCEIFTFGAHHIFTGDLTDVGKWSGNIVLKFNAGSSLSIFGPGQIFKGKYYVHLFGGPSNPAGYNGELTLPTKNYPNGAALLIAGSDPLAEGTC